MSVTRFPNGVGTTRTGALADLPFPDPTPYIVFWDDFVDYNATQWVITARDSGGDSDETPGVASASGGILTITTEDADNDEDFFQWSGATSSAVVGFMRPSVGKKLWFEARVKVDDATQSDIVVGLQPVDTSPLDTSDGIFFVKDDGDANLDLYVEKDSGGVSQAAAATLSDNTWAKLGFYYNGKNTSFYKDGVLIHVSTDTIPNDVDLTVSFGIKAGATGHKTLSIDYVFACLER